MLFDAQAALADILKSQPPIATPATFATNSPVPALVSQLSRVSQPVTPANGCTGSFGTAAQPLPAGAYRHGRDLQGNPKTWTGRAVTLEVWHELTDWERNGSTGKVWNGLMRAWEPATDFTTKGNENA